MEQHTFSALVTFNPSARDDLVVRYLDRTWTSCIVEPGSGRYFPAAVRCLAPTSPRRVIYATVRTPLLPGEAEIFFGPGQAFAVWADAIVGDDALRGEGLVCVGVVLGCELTAAPRGTGQEPVRPQDRRQLPYRRTVAQPRPGLDAPAMAGRP